MGKGIGGYGSEMYYADLLAERGSGFSLQKNTKSTGKNATQSVQPSSKGKPKGK